MNRYKRLALSRGVALCVVALLGIGSAFSQNACFSVQQNGKSISSLGSAWHDLGNGDELTIEYVSGKAVVKNGSAVVVSLPCTDGGELVVEFGETSSQNLLQCNVSTVGYATLYSPFQLTVPSESDVEVYAPTYVDGKLMLTDETRLAAGTVVPPETGLLLKNEGGVAFLFSSSEASSITSALSGSSLVIATPSASGQTIYTLGHASDNTSLFGFYKYAGATLAAGKAYLLATDAQSVAQAFVPFCFDDGATAVFDATSSHSSLRNGKYIEAGHVVIVKNGRKYNVSGNCIR